MTTPDPRPATGPMSRRQLLRGAAAGAGVWALGGLAAPAAAAATGAARKPARINTRISPHRTDRGGQEVTLLVLHESAGITDRRSLAAATERLGVSYHAITDGDGLIYTVDRSDACNALPNGGNPISDNLCLTTPRAGYTRGEWLGPQRDKVDHASWWLATVARERGVDLELLDDEDIRDGPGGVISHAAWDRVTDDPTPHIDPRNFPFDVCLKQARRFDEDSANEDQDDDDEDRNQGLTPLPGPL